MLVGRVELMDRTTTPTTPRLETSWTTTATFTGTNETFCRSWTPLRQRALTYRSCNLKYSLPFLVLSTFFSEFPPIANEQERNDYKREFDRDHQEYKDMQAELDAINKNLAEVDRELDELQEGSPQYLVRA